MLQFDDQAGIYDKRTGLGASVVKQIARSVADYCRSYDDGLLLEVGAGTGEIGYFLQDIPLPYLGMDVSQGMLHQFRKRYETPQDVPQLVHTDANQHWPLEDQSVSVVFSSRAMHQLQHDHVVNELKRVCRPDAILILGNVKRDPQAVKTVMRKEMHKLLNQHGLQEKSGQSHRKQLFSTLHAQGAMRQSPITAARWTVNNTPIDSINSWKNVDGIAGLEVNEAFKHQLLDRLQQKCESLYNDLSQPVESEEKYELNAITLNFNQQH